MAPIPLPKAAEIARDRHWEASHQISRQRYIYLIGLPTLVLGSGLLIAAIHSSFTSSFSSSHHHHHTQEREEEEVSSERRSLAVFILSILGILCLLVGTFTTFGRRGIRLDREAGHVKVWWGIWKLPILDTTYPLEAVRGVEIQQKTKKTIKKNNTTTTTWRTSAAVPSTSSSSSSLCPLRTTCPPSSIPSSSSPSASATISTPSSSSIYSTILLGEVMLLVNIHKSVESAKAEAASLSRFVTIDTKPPLLV